MDDRKVLVLEELVRGREFANKLGQVINGKDESTTTTTTTPLFAQSLVKNVLRSFTNTLFLLDKYPSYQLPHTIESEDHSQESCKSFTTKNKRGCYKRKRNTQQWEEVSKTPKVDGHRWRKYGQKEILKTKYSRNYYRCTHKYDQNCEATKQVQRIQEKPPLYKTIYFGVHTCNDLLNSEIILDSNNSPSDTSILLSFNNTFPTPTKQECPFLSSFPLPPPSPVKKEELIPSSPLDDNSNNNVTLPPPDLWDVMSSTIYDSVDLDDVNFFVDFDD